MLLDIWRLYRTWVAGVVGYLIGCILMADLAARLAGRGQGEMVDLRAVGSGNPGAANAVSNLGKAWGAGVVAGDMAKGLVAAELGRVLAGNAGAYAAGIGVVAGHCFPASAEFKGGKGLAPAAGSSLITFPAWFVVNLGLLGATYKATKSAAIASYVTSAAFVLGSLVWWRFRLPNLWGTKPSGGLPAYTVLATAMICYRFVTAPAHMGDRARGEE
jgi:glycerol-3-phosphate acyltransferase PlsY